MKMEKHLKKPWWFWGGPFLAGVGLAVGYGLTQRISILQGDHRNQSHELFKAQKPFPGERLKSLRKLHGQAKVPIQSNLTFSGQRPSKNAEITQSGLQLSESKEPKSLDLQSALNSLTIISENPLIIDPSYEKSTNSNQELEKTNSIPKSIDELFKTLPKP